MSSTAYAIAAIGISKSFGGVPALRGVDLRVRAGEIHALLGQNGAGKSTLVKILNGVHRAGSFAGTISVLGRPVAFASPAAARASGVGYVPQEIEVLEHLSAAENVFAGQTGLGRSTIVRPAAMERAAAGLFADLGLPFDPRALAATLTPAQRHLIMLVRALALGPAVLMLDEPTASLSGVEVERLMLVLRRLRARGTTMIYITHRLAEVLAVCDRATVLRDGAVAAEFARDSFDTDALIASMTGRRLQALYPQHRMPQTAAPVLLGVEHLTVARGNGVLRGVNDVSFELHGGEIVGLAGLVGSGRTELLGALFGRHAYSGRISVAGRPVTIRRPRDARAAGLALLTEDRKRDGLLFNLPVRANITIGNLAPFARRGLIRREAEATAALRAMGALNVKSPSAESAVAQLSGGNQQKLLLARVLMNRPKVLLLDEPTKGVDVGTRQEIYRLIVELAEAGVALLVVSSEIEEVIGLADRCLVIAEGRIVDAFRRGEGGEERALRAIAAAEAQRLSVA
jgi:ribose transport system ATP-binding protein/D-xylose transport system ATP-binding protein